MTLHFNMPFSLPVLVGRCFADPYREDCTTDVWLGSEIDPIPLGRRRFSNGQITEYWLLVQNDTAVLVAYWSGMPLGLRDGDAYDVGFATIPFGILL